MEEDKARVFVYGEFEVPMRYQDGKICRWFKYTYGERERGLIKRVGEGGVLEIKIKLHDFK